MLTLVLKCRATRPFSRREIGTSEIFARHFSEKFFAANLSREDFVVRRSSRWIFSRGIFAALCASRDSAGQSCHSEKILRRSLFDHVASRRSAG